MIHDWYLTRVKNAWKISFNWKKPPFTPPKASQQVVPEDRYSWKESCRFRRTSRKCSLNASWLGKRLAFPKKNVFFGQLNWKRQNSKVNWCPQNYPGQSVGDVAFCLSRTCLDAWSFWNRKYILHCLSSSLSSLNHHHQQKNHIKKNINNKFQCIKNPPSLSCHESCADWILQSLLPR